MNIKTSNISNSGFFLLLLGVLGGLGGELSFAQTYPVRPIRMIVAYPPGGGTDIVGRMMGQKLGENLGQTVVVDNRGGATGNIGTELAAHATADGYTLLMGNVAPNAINVSLFKKLPFDPVKDFAPVSLVAVTPNILVVQPCVSGKNGEGPDRARKVETGPAQLSLRRRRRLVASRGGDAQVDGGNRHGACAVQGGGPAWSRCCRPRCSSCSPHCRPRCRT